MLDETLIKTVLDRCIKRPKLYNHICYGGSTNCILDVWTDSERHKCHWHRRGQKNWLTPKCKSCDGVSRSSEKTNNAYEENFNRNIAYFANELITELSKNPCNYQPKQTGFAEKRYGLWAETPVN